MDVTASDDVGGRKEEVEKIDSTLSNSDANAVIGEKEQKEDSCTDAQSDIAKGAFYLSDSIIMYNDQPICAEACVFRGVMMNGVHGNQNIAVKYLPYDEMHIREAKILRELGSHPNVVTYFHSDVYTKGPYPAMYIAMELCEKLNLHDRIQQNKKDNIPFDPEASMSQSKEVLVGVDFIHRKGVIYRDLKPQNILISHDGVTIKIADFGLSKPLRNGRSVTRQSLRGAGTDGYRAPETYNNDVISRASDIYSLALVMYFIWSYGCHPFGYDHDDWNSNIKRNRNRNLRQLKIPNRQLAEDLLKWMLQFLPGNRPNTEQIQQHALFTGSSESSPAIDSASASDRYHTGVIKEETVDDMSEEESLEALLEEERCQELMKESKYVQALMKLQALLKQGRRELSTQLLVIECNLQLGRDKNVKAIMTDLKQSILTDRHRNIHEINGLMDECMKKSFHIRTMVLLQCVVWLYKHDASPEKVMEAGVKYTTKAHKMFESLEKSGRHIVVAYAIAFPALLELLEDVQSAMRGHPGIDPLKEVMCLYQIGGSYHELSDYRNSIQYFMQAIEVMTNTYGSKATRYRLLGSLYNNAGTAQAYLGNYAEAESLLLQSIDAETEALDFPSEEEKLLSIEGTQGNLRRARNRICN